MGEVCTRLKIIGPTGESEIIDGVPVDTGSEWTYLAPDRVERIGARMVQKRAAVKVGDGKLMYGPVYEVQAEIMGVRRLIKVHAVAELDQVLGMHALQAFRFIVDPEEERLIPKGT